MIIVIKGSCDFSLYFSLYCFYFPSSVIADGWNKNNRSKQKNNNGDVDNNGYTNMNNKSNRK